MGEERAWKPHSKIIELYNSENGRRIIATSSSNSGRDHHSVINKSFPSHNATKTSSMNNLMSDLSPHNLNNVQDVAMQMQMRHLNVKLVPYTASAADSVEREESDAAPAK